MTRRELIQYISGLDGTPLDPTDHQVARFSFRGKNYILNLFQENAEKLEQVLEPYTANASTDHSMVATPREHSSVNPNVAEVRDRNHRIRQWARENGTDVVDRSVLPKHITEKYESASQFSPGFVYPPLDFIQFHYLKDRVPPQRGPVSKLEQVIRAARAAAGIDIPTSSDCLIFFVLDMEELARSYFETICLTGLARPQDVAPVIGLSVSLVAFPVPGAFSLPAGVHGMWCPGVPYAPATYLGM